MAHILVIKHGALGDFCQAFSAFATLRHHFPSDHLTLLTSSLYRALAECSPWFDDVLVDDRPSWTHWRHHMWIRQLLRRVDKVIDLQNSGRTQSYFRLAGRPAWSGQHAKSDKAHTNPQRRAMHGLARQNDQLRTAGLTPLPRHVPDWLTAEGPVLSPPYAVLVPGAAAHRPAKRWPVRRFAALAQWLVEQDIQPVIVGDAAQHGLGSFICNTVPSAHDLTGRTSLPELAGLLHRAAFAVGNDTGPMHMAATMDCPSLTLFSHDSDPRLCAPLSLTPGYSRSLVTRDLATLSAERVCRYLQDWAFPLLNLEPQQKSVQNILMIG
ncbi:MULTISPECIES: glycosyltransferase family 9 protein [unclassified Saccharibacter]|uniref:glycosyltransferase family 9 protein n=1 Tax=unclassified Saccharibacter TaxID=2648722 RepID=UPI001323DF0B|nr:MULTISPECIES: glycosyltransferase family 9 protein [unclassified Saccharibacter]MXV36679.1 ADP-heptose--LPS heptosyltransferase [Saccharibacter sp. EH611]MXV58761.1 ADP-heptose--LPS heptosyltransferase [Saccharibacter sp. EH70]MXV65627.1 ADP-heptose--LPS heptosyltransferase [Saccharibacter sp. EH60]